VVIISTLYDNYRETFNIPRRGPEELVKEKDRPDGLKRLNRLKDLSRSDFLEMIYDFVYVYRATTPVAEKWGLTPMRCRYLISTFCSDLINLEESFQLAEELPHIVDPQFSLKLNNSDRRIDDIARMKIVHINEKFLAKLSKEDEALSEAEQTYAWVFVHTGDNNDALEKAGLDVGLIPNMEEYPTAQGLRKKRNPEHEINLQNGLRLRGYYLRSKKNVKEYIQALRERKLEDINIDKGYIQSQLVTLIEQLKEEGDVKQRNNLLKAIEMLGKTVPGTFSETINVAEVRPDEALDRLLELTKADISKPKAIGLSTVKPLESPILVENV